MKKSVLVSFMLLICLKSFSQEQQIDPNAINILDRMSEVIGSLNSCSFQVNTSIDHMDQHNGLVKQFSQHEIYMVGPDKMHIQTKGAKGNHAYWYNGDLLMYYSLTHNHYGFIETPDNIIETIDMVNADYGIDFPAADFFYPTFTDDLLENMDKIAYLGLVSVDGEDCHHIVASGPDQHIQIWLRNDTFTLPLRFVILEKSGELPLQYEAVFSKWSVNPNLPDAIFDFVVPETAKRLSFVSKSRAN
ncbi:DUF2092 domain-containing protein [Cyclobacteriaceae bacterium YHN15]|nr:DUF2092 domain-containing protein [Cyclobacteriaceae bacterium YHN15]